jgi:hypothetical protein
MAKDEARERATTPRLQQQWTIEYNHARLSYTLALSLSLSICIFVCTLRRSRGPKETQELYIPSQAPKREEKKSKKDEESDTIDHAGRVLRNFGEE